MGDSRRIKVGNWAVAPAQNLLQREGKSVRIKPRSMEVLVYLASHAGEVVSADELIEAVWRDRIVGDGAVYQSITQLRHALGDSTEEARFIETIPKRGYRLVAPVTTLAPESKQEASQGVVRQATSRKLGFAIAVLVLVIAVLARYVPVGSTSFSTEDRRSLAVLPFVNQSAAEENAEFFADGIHDELLNQLANIDSLRVISRTSVEEYRGTLKNMRDIGRELGVTALLEGRVQRVGDLVQIIVQLINAETDEHLWGDTYEAELTAQSIFAIQRKIAIAIAAALQATLSPQDEARLNEVPTENTLALTYYLTGNIYANRGDDNLAVQQYDKAVEEDPAFTLAWAALSHAHSRMYWHGADPAQSRLDLALDTVERALTLDPDSPEAHLAKGSYYHLGFRDHDRALEEYANAEQLGLRGSAELFEARAMTYRRAGQVDESIASLDLAIGLDPLNIDLLSNQAGTYRSRRDYAQADQYLTRVLDLAPDDLGAYRGKALIPLWRDGDLTPARVVAKSLRAKRLGFYFWWIFALYDGEYDKALDYLDLWEEDEFASTMWYVPAASYRGTMHRLAGREKQAEQEFEIARVHLEDALAANPDDARIVLALGEAMVGLGRDAEGVELAHEAMALLPPSRDAIVGHRIQLDAVRRVFAPAGESDAAIVALETYLAGPGQWSIEGLLPDPRLDPIRDDPRFRAVVAKYKRQ